MEGKQEGLWLPLHGLFASWKASANGKLPYFLFASFFLFRPSFIAPSSLLLTSSFLYHLQPFPVSQALSFEAPYLPIFFEVRLHLALWEMEMLFPAKPLWFVPEMQILPSVVSLRAGVLMLWPAAPTPHRVSLTGPHLCAVSP